MSYQYFRVTKKWRHYKGERYFRFDPYKDHVLQVCVGQGQKKKGRSNTIGLYEIARVTFLSNYFGMNMVESIPKSEFKKMFNKIYLKLKP